MVAKCWSNAQEFGMAVNPVTCDSESCLWNKTLRNNCTRASLLLKLFFEYIFYTNVSEKIVYPIEILIVAKRARAFWESHWISLGNPVTSCYCRDLQTKSPHCIAAHPNSYTQVLAVTRKYSQPLKVTRSCSQVLLASGSQVTRRWLAGDSQVNLWRALWLADTRKGTNARKLLASPWNYD